MINIEVLQKIQSRGFALRDGFRNVSSVGGINQFAKKWEINMYLITSLEKLTYMAGSDT